MAELAADRGQADDGRVLCALQMGRRRQKQCCSGGAGEGGRAGGVCLGPWKRCLGEGTGFMGVNVPVTVLVAFTAPLECA